ncbi:hypothetical protein NM208_g13397 [Fusarium decemcellulare]|uniref:Uncharacterized protein n=1 Tax=Fusarium decemcellulare TaxID=57161 RepID=A0ACC1RK10_9HYPO|nr:hypothetical protein NM208_g13397 [Fusarium decemcellulare]
MVVPQAKTLGTHKIYFDPSPPIRSRRRQTANYPRLSHRYAAQPAPARILEHFYFARSISPSESVTADELYRSFDRVPPIPAFEFRPSCPTSKSASRSLAWVPELVCKFLRIFYAYKRGDPHTDLRIIGGKGTPRRKVKRAPARSGADDKKLQQTLKKLNTQPIQAIEEVNMFKSDGNVIHFAAPKVHAAVPANTFAIYGNGEDKELTELVPGILNQLGPDSLASLRKLAESYQNMQKEKGDDEDDIPDLVEGENFESKVE